MRPRIDEVLREHDDALLRDSLARELHSQFTKEQTVLKRPEGVLILYCCARNAFVDKLNVSDATRLRVVEDVHDVTPLLICSMLRDDTFFVRQTMSLWMTGQYRMHESVFAHMCSRCRLYE